MAPTQKPPARALVCPGCRASLTLEPARGQVSCGGCGRLYPLRDGVAVLLLSEARSVERPPVR